MKNKEIKEQEKTCVFSMLEQKKLEVEIKRQEMWLKADKIEQARRNFEVLSKQHCIGASDPLLDRNTTANRLEKYLKIMDSICED